MTLLFFYTATVLHATQMSWGYLPKLCCAGGPDGDTKICQILHFDPQSVGYQASLPNVGSRVHMLSSSEKGGSWYPSHPEYLIFELSSDPEHPNLDTVIIWYKCTLAGKIFRRGHWRPNNAGSDQFRGPVIHIGPRSHESGKAPPVKRYDPSQYVYC